MGAAPVSTAVQPNSAVLVPLQMLRQVLQQHTGAEPPALPALLPSVAYGGVKLEFCSSLLAVLGSLGPAQGHAVDVPEPMENFMQRCCVSAASCTSAQCTHCCCHCVTARQLGRATAKEASNATLQTCTSSV